MAVRRASFCMPMSSPEGQHARLQMDGLGYGLVLRKRHCQLLLLFGLYQCWKKAQRAVCAAPLAGGAQVELAVGAVHGEGCVEARGIGSVSFFELG